MTSGQQQQNSHILTLAREILAEVGYEGLTVRALATRANVPAATLYSLYGSKDELVLTVIDDLLGILSTRGEPAAGIDSILSRARVCAQQILETPEYAEAVIRALIKDGMEGSIREELFARSFAFVSEQLELAQQEGEIVPGADVEVLARHLLSQQWGLVLSWMMGMVALQDLERETIRGQLLVLSGAAAETASKRLEELLAEV